MKDLDFKDFITSKSSITDLKSVMISNSLVQKFKPIIDYLCSNQGEVVNLYVDTKKLGYKGSSFTNLIRRALKILILFSDDEDKIKYSVFSSNTMFRVLTDDEVCVSFRLAPQYSKPKVETAEWKESMIDFVIGGEKGEKIFNVPNDTGTKKIIESICRDGLCEYSFIGDNQVKIRK